jgi:F-type H+-transporting ATPase subunit delta
MPRAVANRYARALADVVAAKADYRSVLGELREFAQVYGASPELREVLESPAVLVAQKIRVLDAILHRVGTSWVSSNFLRVLVTHYRLNLLEEICQAFLEIAYDRLGVIQIKVFSTSGLGEADQQALRARFQELTRQEVELEFHLEPDLIGGIRAQIGSTVYDGSVRGNLQRIRQQLTAQ